MKETRQRIAIYILAAAAFASAFLAWPALAQAASNINIITLPWDDPAKKPIQPAFILPRQNRWGCLACHSNQSLSKFRDGRQVSLFIDPNIIGNSMHKNIACIDCHTNFSYEEHPAKSPTDFRKVAGLACMKCHPYQAYLYKNSVHGNLALQNKLGKIAGKSAQPALCSSCHGFHDIQSPRFDPYKSKFRAAGGRQVCGKCHTDRYASYRDYYHGKAYKNGANDAPVCWDCHSNHRVLKAKDPDSAVNSDNLTKTCGKCHIEPTPIFTSYAGLIHGRATIVGNNPIVRLVRAIFPGSKGKEPRADNAVKPVSTSSQESESLITRIIRFFFPSSLRPEKP